MTSHGPSAVCCEPPPAVDSRQCCRRVPDRCVDAPPRCSRARSELLLDCGDGGAAAGLPSARSTPQRPAARAAAARLGRQADSSYVLSLAALLWQHGFDVVRLNLRDHGATHHLNRELFHCCRLSDVSGAVRALSQQLPHARAVPGRLLARRQLHAARRGLERGTRDARGRGGDLAGARTGGNARGARTRGCRSTATISCGAGRARCAASSAPGPRLHDFETLLRTADLRAMTAALVATLHRLSQSRGLPARLRDHRRAARDPARAVRAAAGGG